MDWKVIVQNVHVTWVPTRYAPELDLIKKLCDYEGYSFCILYPERKEYKYYKGGHPAILIYEEVDAEPTVLYGFWEFAQFLLKNGMVRC